MHSLTMTCQAVNVQRDQRTRPAISAARLAIYLGIARMPLLRVPVVVDSNLVVVTRNATRSVTGS